MKKTLFFLMTFGSFQVIAQPVNIRISSLASDDPEEVTISVNPRNPLQLVAGANLNYVYYSNDGGITWVENYLSSSYEVAGDPVVMFDSSGNAYYAHLSGSTSNWLDRMVIQKSTDGGVTWNDGAFTGLNMPKQQDKEWLIFDMTQSPYRNNVYITWTEFDEYASTSSIDSTRILFSRSSDFGNTWTPALRINSRSGDCIDEDNTVEGAVPAVGPNGEIYVSWAGPLGIVFDKSLDGGNTWGVDVPVATTPGGWAFNISGISRANGLPFTFCDVSNSAYRGNIYIMWSDLRNGASNGDIFIARSTDGGNTWSAPIRVNDDATIHQQFFPCMTIDQTNGDIYIVFYDRRNYTDERTDVYVAKSIDGGLTFTNFIISQIPFDPNPSVFFGDYIGITAWGGKAWPIWMRMDAGDLSVWTAVIDPTTNVSEYHTQLDYGLTQNYPNPFMDNTQISYSLMKTAQIELKIINAIGQTIEILDKGLKKEGVYCVSWNGCNEAGIRQSQGVYTVLLQAERFTYTRKIILVDGN
ncbi:MAG: T9SS type A sorting domain-containing protein [Bacteroidota bacterium]